MRALLLWPVLFVLALPAWADARLTVLIDVLKVEEAAQILRQEGLGFAEEINTDMLDGQGGAGWHVQVDAIYDTARMVEQLRSSLGQALVGDELEQVIDFFASDLGGRIVTLENSARAAIIAPDVEEAARARYAALAGSGDARLAQIDGFVSANDMIDRNVTSALNSNYQFMRGMVDGDAFAMSDEEILNDVSGDIDGITSDTTEWLYGFFLLAYHPLEDDELQRYIAFSKTPAGQALNNALFDGFGKAYEDISYALGRAVALNMTAEEL